MCVNPERWICAENLVIIAGQQADHFEAHKIFFTSFFVRVCLSKEEYLSPGCSKAVLWVGFIYSLTFLFHRYLWNAGCVPGTMELSTGWWITLTQSLRSRSLTSQGKTEFGQVITSVIIIGHWPLICFSVCTSVGSNYCTAFNKISLTKWEDQRKYVNYCKCSIGSSLE